MIDLTHYYLEDQTYALKQKIEKSNKFRYWLKRRLEEDERSIEHATPTMQVPIPHREIKGSSQWAFISQILP